MKKFAYFAAVSVVFIAQAVSAQTVTASKPVPGLVNVVNQAVTLKAVTPRTATTAAASVTLANGVVWSFDGSGNVASAGATVAGVAVSPNKLTAGMSCVLNGTRAPGRNTIATLACK
jgi:hypothetical protein